MKTTLKLSNSFVGRGLSRDMKGAHPSWALAPEVPWQSLSSSRQMKTVE